MPRSNRPRRNARGQPRSKWARAAEPSPLRGFGLAAQSTESARDGEWNVRRIGGGRAEKVYTCPGCHGTIASGTEHIVAWRADDWRGDEAAGAARRHWHTHCWRTRIGR
ncbi:hypothetical protein GCM10027591_01930 [Zhihengliuella somnathii]